MEHVTQWTTPLSQIIIAMVFVGSFIVGYYTLHILRQANELAVLKNIMDEYNKLVATDCFTSYQAELQTWKEDLLESRLTPHTFYYFKLKHISTIGQFYDYTGVLIQKRLVPFSLVFEVLPFPHLFWEETEEFRANMQELTYADFWSHFAFLHEQFTEERNRRHKPAPRKAVLQES